MDTYPVLLAIMIFFILYYTFSESYTSDRVDDPNNPIKYIKSMRTGIIRGVIGGMLTGNYESMVTNAVSFGLLNPMIKYIE